MRPRSNSLDLDYLDDVRRRQKYDTRARSQSLEFSSGNEDELTPDVIKLRKLNAMLHPIIQREANRNRPGYRTEFLYSRIIEQVARSNANGLISIDSADQPYIFHEGDHTYDARPLPASDVLSPSEITLDPHTQLPSGLRQPAHGYRPLSGMVHIEEFSLLNKVKSLKPKPKPKLKNIKFLADFYPQYGVRLEVADPERSVDVVDLGQGRPHTRSLFLLSELHVPYIDHVMMVPPVGKVPKSIISDAKKLIYPSAIEARQRLNKLALFNVRNSLEIQEISIRQNVPTIPDLHF